MNTFEQNLSSVGIAALGNVFLGDEVSRFIVSQVNANKSVDLIGILRRISPNSPMIDVAVVSAMPGIDRKMSYSGKG